MLSDVVSQAVTLGFYSSQGYVVIDSYKRLHGDSFLQLQNNEQIAILHTCPSLLEVLMPNIALAYYQDPRILTALSLKDSPPFPGGYAVDQGDWSLLDPVRKRKPLYRIP